MNIILFDGLCGLCDYSVQFILKRDSNAFFKFASLQSDYAKKILLEHKQDLNRSDSLLLIENGELYDKSTAVLKIASNLTYPWRFLKVFLFLPKSFRDLFYTLISENRYRIIPKKNQCTLPSPEFRKRFLDL